MEYEIYSGREMNLFLCSYGVQLLAQRTTGAEILFLYFPRLNGFTGREKTSTLFA
jgi:hypothetical protein